MSGGCTSDPTAGCTENTEIVAEIGSCCTETNNNLSAIATKLDTINATQVECCEDINTKLTTVISLLTTIANK